MKHLACLLMVVLLFSCSSASSIDNIVTVEIDMNDVDKRALFTDVEYIKLETSQESLINYVENIIIARDTIIIHSLFDQFVGFFAKDGTFINRLTIGNGPNEILNPADVCIDDQTGELWILDRYTNLRAFSFLGKDLNKTVKTNHGYMKIGRFKGTHMLFDSNMSKQNDYCYRFIEDGKEIDLILKDKRFAQLLYIPKTAFSALNDSVILFNQQFSDIIYSWNSDNRTCRDFLYLKFKGAQTVASWTGDYVIEHKRDGEYQDWYKEKKYIFGIQNMIAYNNRIFFTAQKDKQTYFLYDVEHKRLTSHAKLLNGFPDIQSIYKGPNGTLVFYLKPHEIIEFINNTDSCDVSDKLHNLSKSIVDDDNPILFIIDTKKNS